MKTKSYPQKYKYTPRRSTLQSVERTQGETIEQKVRRIVNNKEPIRDGATLVYTERKSGVQPEFNIRTDRFELATEAMDKVSKSFIASRDDKGKVIDLNPDTTDGKKDESKESSK